MLSQFVELNCGRYEEEWSRTKMRSSTPWTIVLWSSSLYTVVELPSVYSMFVSRSADIRLRAVRGCDSTWGLPYQSDTKHRGWGARASEPASVSQLRPTIAASSFQHGTQAQTSGTFTRDPPLLVLYRTSSPIFIDCSVHERLIQCGEGS